MQWGSRLADHVDASVQADMLTRILRVLEAVQLSTEALETVRQVKSNMMEMLTRVDAIKRVRPGPCRLVLLVKLPLSAPCMLMCAMLTCFGASVMES